MADRIGQRIAKQTQIHTPFRGVRVTRRRSPVAQQWDTHLPLLARTNAQLAGRSSASLDAIIVPASRHAVNLDHAVTLARALQCELVVLCSVQAQSSDVNELLALRNFHQAIVVDVPAGYRHPLLDFATSAGAGLDLPRECINPNGDLSIKRNLGLLLARMLGWNRVFFMDDDIRDLTPSDVRLTVSMLGPYHAVGMRAIDFPDNSVVCHGHRETGEFQEVFISGSLLAVDCTRPLAFFPAVYNEDWFFFYDHAAARKLGWSGRDATQLCYDPFADPLRAAGQEFGDVLAEGLYSLLHCGVEADQAVSDYWQLFLESRREFLEAVLARSDKVETHLRTRIISSIQTAKMWSGEITPAMCARYIECWQDDLAAWEQQLTKIPRMSSATAALAQLLLAPSGRSPYALARVIGGTEVGMRTGAEPRSAPTPQDLTQDLFQRIRSVATAQSGEVAVNGSQPAAQIVRPLGEAAQRYARAVIGRAGKYAAALLAQDKSEVIRADRSPGSSRLAPGRHRRALEPFEASYPVEMEGTYASEDALPA
jgi:hypothetical protein